MDVIAQAQSGTGKTATFSIAILEKIDTGLRECQALMEAIAAGHATIGSGGLWEERAGLEARAVIDTLIAEAPHGGRMSALDFADLLDTLLSGAEVRDRDAPYPGVMIWGTLEARVQGADLLILGGLNEGTWPEAPSPDPWLNRTMRHRAGLLLPERRIGLSAHDFQQAAAAPAPLRLSALGRCGRARRGARWRAMVWRGVA